MTDENIEYIKIENLRRVDVQLGDIFVLFIKESISAQTYDLIQKEWKNGMGGEEAPKLLIIQDGMELGIIRPRQSTSEWIIERFGEISTEKARRHNSGD